MSEYQAFQVELNANIAHVKINRPEKVNAMNAAFWTEIIDIFSALMRTMRYVPWYSVAQASIFRQAST